MKEFIEKLIGRLEETRWTTIFDTSCIFENDKLDKCIEIVNKLAEEYKHCDLCYLESPCEYQNPEISCEKCIEYDTEEHCCPKFCKVITDTIQEMKEEHNGGWIPCSEKMPPVETEVWIVAKRKWKDGTYKYVTTTAMYEDGTVLENDSCWRWEDIEGEWNEEEDCYIIPEGWWENKHYNADGELNHAVDDEVIAWQPLPPKYEPKGE